MVAQAMTVTENMLAGHSDLDGIFASNESSSIGAAQAMRGRAGKNQIGGI
ncbi:MAG TPA: hypothetical protein VK776_04155 [Bryobacteraceae bacterium]|jgi:ribose transport system substrate-binding protein|nr:hypothetical protein [Bryobacteraceae bacterium]